MSDLERLRTSYQDWTISDAGNEGDVHAYIEALEAKVERLEARVAELETALAHYATDEEPWGWVAIEALRGAALAGEGDEHD